MDFTRLRANLKRRQVGSRVLVEVYQKDLSPPRRIEQTATFQGFLREDSHHHLVGGQHVAVLVEGERELRVVHFSFVRGSAPRARR